MKKNNAIKGLLLGVLGFMTLGIAACNSSSLKDEYTGFLEGAQTTINIGDSVLIKDIIDAAEKGTYTVTITHNGEVEDITRRVAWQPIEVGTYVLTYTINEGKNKGTYTHTLEVVSSRYIALEYDLSPITVLYEEEMGFERFFESLNISVASHQNWEAVMLNVRIDDEIIEFDENQTSYKIESYSEHFFTAAIRTADGRERKFTATVSPVYSFDESDIWLSATANGEYTIGQADVETVIINGVVCSEEDVLILGECVKISETVLHDKYSGVNNVSLLTKSGEDVRKILNVYTETFTMESPIPKDIFFFERFCADTKGAKMDVYNGENVWKMWGNGKWQAFHISREYVEFIFKNPNIDLLSFDFVVDFEATNGVEEITLTNYINRTSKSYKKGEKTTITILRSDYENYKGSANEEYCEGDLFFVFGNETKDTGCVLLNWYISNVRGEQIHVSDDVLIHNFNNKPSDFTIVEPYYTTTSTNKNNNGTLVDGYSGETSGNWQQFMWWGGAYGKAADDFAHRMNFENRSVPANAKLYGYSVAVFDEVFADQSVQAISWECLVAKYIDSGNVDTIITNVGSITEVWQAQFKCNEWFTLTLTREQYNAIKAANLEYLSIALRNSKQTNGAWGTNIAVGHDNFKRVFEAQLPVAQPLISDFNNQTNSYTIVEPYYTTTSTNKNNNGTLVDGYSGETSGNWQQFMWWGGAYGKAADDFAHRMNFENRSVPANAKLYGYSVAFFDEIFADERVQAITWELCVAKYAAGNVDTITTNVDSITGAWQAEFKCDEWFTLRLTREQYNAIKAAGLEYLSITLSNSQQTNGAWGTNIAVAHDNFRRVFKDE